MIKQQTITVNFGNYWLLVLLASWLLISCRQNNPLFTLTDPAETGVTFQNSIPVNDTAFNILDYIYYYNGGGVAVGDINNDGLIDIYFSANTGVNKLYLNKGNFVFEDITNSAGVKGISNWKTGVTMADVNGDGLLDIYVSAVGDYKSLHGHNELYINNGDLSFTESAKTYGLDVVAFGTQASFFDYDKDGDLDMFLVCHSVHSTESFRSAAERKLSNPLSGDKLFRNDRVNDSCHFTEVTNAAGIYSSAIGYGLNVMIADFNNDNWDDIYVSNDFHENDYYYLNNGDGTFTEKNAAVFGHESRFSMGSDVADVNNDGWEDMLTLDMLPQDEKVLKSSASDDNYDIYRYKMDYGYHTQYSRNCLQLNQGSGNYFSEVGLYSGVAATDWSWSPLVADFDNDGIKDLFITNGIARRPNDLDYVKFTSDPTRLDALEKGKALDKQAVDKMPEGKAPNYMYQGTRNVKFIDRSKDWGFARPTLSNGAAYADLDNDGDLDIIINNLNEPAALYRNNSRGTNGYNFLDVALKTTGLNNAAFGAKVLVKNAGGIQVNYVTGSRGFLSASTKTIHFGLGAAPIIDTLEVHWPSGTVQQLFHVKANQRLVISEGKPTTNVQQVLPGGPVTASALLKDITRQTGLRWKHSENNFIDFNAQPLIPHMISTQGPKIAVADINQDGLDDFFVCGARDQPSALFVQDAAGEFTRQQVPLFATDAASEDVNALFFDANGDGAPDLYVVTGGNEFWGNENVLQDRLYLNDGKGIFTKSNGLPLFYGNKSVAVAADVDHDGDLDLFVGGRVVAKRYGDTPPSFLLKNDGKGNFTIAPDNLAPGLQQIGMVTDASWTDKNKDGWPDLVVVGEWMPITIFMNRQGSLENTTQAEGLAATTGLWCSVISADLDGDGFPELLAGNWGENSKLKASDQYPLELYAGDMDENGSFEQVLAIAKNEKYYTFSNKEDLEKQFPALIKKRFEKYAEMAGLAVNEVMGQRLEKMKRLTAKTLSTSLLWNNGGKYSLQKMPAELQWSPVFAWAVHDFNGDGRRDLLAAGNFYGVIPYEGRYDANCGQVLLGRGKDFTPLSPRQSGFVLKGEIRSIQPLRTLDHKTVFLVAANNDSLRVIAP